jgi:hypothetical protein
VPIIEPTRGDDENSDDDDDDGDVPRGVPPSSRGHRGAKIGGAITVNQSSAAK